MEMCHAQHSSSVAERIGFYLKFDYASGVRAKYLINFFCRRRHRVRYRSKLNHFDRIHTKVERHLAKIKRQKKHVEFMNDVCVFGLWK